MALTPQITDIEQTLTLPDGLAPYADDFMQAETTYGVSAVFLAAVATLESGGGASKLAREKNNLFGWTGSNGYRSFESKEECIDFVARNIARMYLDPDGPYYNGASVEGVSVAYCNGNPEWVRLVYELMGEVGGYGAGTEPILQYRLHGGDGAVP